MARSESKSAMWNRLAGEARAALEALKEMQDAYTETFDNMNEGLQQSPYGQKLEAMGDIDIDGALSILDDIDGADLPLGFGRD